MHQPETAPNVLAIQSHQASAVWDLVEPWIEPAATPNGYTTEWVLQQIQAGQMQLWAGANWACVTQVHTLPLWRTLVIVLLGGENMDDWFEDLIVELEEWGRQIGCQYVECHGRRGWEKIGKHLGYERVRVTLRKEL